MSPSMFSFTFQCVGTYEEEPCGRILEMVVYKAQIDGEGVRVACKKCEQHYLVKADGAHPIDPDEVQSFIDAKGERFTLSNWDPSQADIPVPKFPPMEGHNG